MLLQQLQRNKEHLLLVVKLLHRNYQRWPLLAILDGADLMTFNRFAATIVLSLMEIK